GIELEQLDADWIPAGRRNLIADKRAATAGRIDRIRVVDRGGHFAEIAVFHPRGRNGQCRRARSPNQDALVVNKEERRFPRNRSRATEREAEFVAALRGFPLTALIRKKVIGVELVVPQKLV